MNIIHPWCNLLRFSLRFPFRGWEGLLEVVGTAEYSPSAHDPCETEVGVPIAAAGLRGGAHVAVASIQSQPWKTNHGGAESTSTACCFLSYTARDGVASARSAPSGESVQTTL